MTIEISEGISPQITRSLEAFSKSLRGFYQDLRILSMAVHRLSDDSGMLVEAVFQDAEGIHQFQRIDQEISDPRYTAEDWERRGRELIRRAVLEMTGLRPAWGILTGVRPGKLYRMMQKKGFNPSEIFQRLKDLYLLEASKADLLRGVSEIQAPFIQFHPREIGVYLGIPFCPTRCRYCSFASRPLGSHGHLVAPFVEAAKKEIAWMVDCCNKMGWVVKTIYVGGGTPTSISASELRSILMALKQFPLEDNLEFTVEAGRPETIDESHLDVCVEAGVNRISVNPQTLHEDTLQRIGRAHSVDDVFRAVERVRDAGIPTLNMDLIAGLPSETLSMFTESVQGVLDCHPENITLHTLAPKRAAEWSEERLAREISEEDLARGLEGVGAMIRNEGYHPYYLYRQRRILANQENIGYSLHGQESLYNIWMMEETRTIVGLGGGAVTKWVNPIAGTVERWSNPKCPATFAQQVESAMQEKAKWLKGHHN